MDVVFTPQANRKRQIGDGFSSVSKMPRNYVGSREVVKANNRLLPSSASKTTLFTNGDILSLTPGNESTLVSVCMEALATNAASCVRAEFPLNGLLSLGSEHVDMFYRSSGTREFIACSPAGDFYMYSIRPDGRVTERLSLSLELEEEDEQVTRVKHADSVFIAATSCGNVLLLQAVGESDLTITTLQRTQLSIAGFFQTIGRLIRGSGEQVSRRPVRSVSFLDGDVMCIGDTLSIWSNWSSGNESCKDLDLIGSLVAFLEQSGVSYQNRIRVIDVVASDEEDKSFPSVVVLVAISPNHAISTNACEPCSLYLFSARINANKAPSNKAQGNATCEITGKLLLDHNCVVGFGSSHSDCGLFASHATAGDIFTYWFVFSDSVKVGEAEAAKSSIRFARISTRDIPSVSFDLSPDMQALTIAASVEIPSAATAGQSVARPAFSSAKDSQSSNSTNSPTLASICSIGRINRFDNICALLGDGSIVELFPNRTFPYVLKKAGELLQPDYIERSFATEATTTAKKRAAVVDLTNEDSLRELLTQVIRNGGIDVASAQLEQALRKLAPTELQSLIIPISREIVDRVPSGQHWGNGGSFDSRQQQVDNDTSDQMYHYKLVQLDVSQKLQQHQALIAVLQSAGLLGSPLGMGSESEAILKHNQQLIAAANGLCGAIQTSQQTSGSSATAVGALGATIGAGGDGKSHADQDILTLSQLDGGSSGSFFGNQLASPLSGMRGGYTQHSQAAAAASTVRHTPMASRNRNAPLSAAPATATATTPLSLRRPVGYNSLAPTSGMKPFGPQSVGKPPSNSHWNQSIFTAEAPMTPAAAAAATQSTNVLSSMLSDSNTNSSTSAYNNSLLAGKQMERAFIEEAKKMGLKVLSEGFHQCVCAIRGNLREEYEAKGLSTADMLFAKCSDLSSAFVGIGRALHSVSQQSHSSTGSDVDRILYASFGTLSLLLTAINAAAAEVGHNSPNSALLSSKHNGEYAIRNVCLEVILSLKKGYLLQAGGVTSSEIRTSVQDSWGSFESSSFGAMLKNFCSVLLNSYVLEEDLKKSDRMWVSNYHAAKESCVSLLLCVGHYRNAFSLAQEYLYFPGLLQSIEACKAFEIAAASASTASSSTTLTASFTASSAAKPGYYPQRGAGAATAAASSTASDFRSMHHMSKLMTDQLRVFAGKHKDAVGTQEEKLLTFLLLDFERMGRPNDILDFGKIDETQLNEFLKARPQLAWLHFLQMKKYSEAADSAIYQSREESSTSTAKALLSIAKLSALVSDGDADDVDDGEGVYAVKEAVFAEPSSRPSHTEAYNTACRGLSLLSSQELLVQKVQANPMLPFASNELRSNLHERLPATLLINNLLAYLREYIVKTVTDRSSAVASGQSGATGSAYRSEILDTLHAVTALCAIRMQDLHRFLHDQTYWVDSDAQSTKELFKREADLLRSQVCSCWSIAIQSQSTECWNRILNIFTNASTADELVLEQALQKEISSSFFAQLLMRLHPEVTSGVIHGQIIPVVDRTDGIDDNYSALLADIIRESGLSADPRATDTLLNRVRMLLVAQIATVYGPIL